MNQPTFNVLTEPWIPVIRLDGTRDELGILPCLEQAHDLREIRDPSPIIEFGLYRLLVAFVLDALVMADKRPEDPMDLKKLINTECFDMDLFRNYVKQCGEEPFELFDPKRPFLQVPLPKANPKPLAAIYPVAPSGTNAGHWWHEHEDEMERTAAEAARLLTTIAPFMTAGGAGLSPSINGAPAIYALPLGSNFFETIVLNLPTRDQGRGNGAVAWRNDRAPGQERTEATMPEAMTWRPRAVQLIAEPREGQVIVRSMKFEKGDSTRLTWIDSNLAYGYERDKVTPVRMREGRPLWRDAGPLLLLHQRALGSGEQKVAFRRPDVVQAAFEVMEGRGSVPIKAYGVRTDMKMKVFEWAEVCWSIPERLGRSPRLGAIVHSELDLAERAVLELRSTLKVLYPRDGAGNKKALGCTASRCERMFWHRLEREFALLMSRFAKLSDDAPDTPNQIENARNPWRVAIRKIATEQFESAAKDMDADSDALERQVRARAKLTNALRKVLE